MPGGNPKRTRYVIPGEIFRSEAWGENKGRRLNRKKDYKPEGWEESKRKNKSENGTKSKRKSGIKSRLKSWGAKEALLDLLYPPRCPICDEVLGRAWGNTASKGMPACGPARKIAPQKRRCCPNCAPVLPRVGEAACMRCGKPLADEGREYCEACMTQRHFFDQGVAAFVYTGPLRHSVYRMKAANRRDYIPFYAEEMTRALERFLPRWRPEIIIPVPMHPRKRRRRGYNQSELLAMEIGKNTGVPVETGLLRCVRFVHSQKELDRQERLKNLRGSFAACGIFPSVSRVLLVDDVYTTGSTMDEISRILREQGVLEIYFVVLCTGKGKKAVCTAGKV